MVNFEILNENDIVIAMSCNICKNIFPITYLNFFPFMKGGVCEECVNTSKSYIRKEIQVEKEKDKK